LRSAEEKASTIFSVEDPSGACGVVTPAANLGTRAVLASTSHRSLEQKFSNHGRVKRRKGMLNFNPSNHLILKRLVVHLDC
jgi:hypothetical protein